VFSRSLRSENAGFPTSRRVIGEHVSYPLLGSDRVTRTAGAAAGISGRVVFAACWAGRPIKAFAKIATPRRRAGQKIKQVGEALASTGTEQEKLVEAKASPTASSTPTIDIGFRVLKIDSSNMKEVYYTPDAVQQGDLADQVDNIREGRSVEDLLFQVLLDWGVDLTLPITQEIIAGLTVLFVDGNALAACFDTDINDDCKDAGGRATQGAVAEAFVKELAARHPLRVVFRDAGFASDSVKINIEQIFKLLSPSTEIKTL